MGRYREMYAPKKIGISWEGRDFRRKIFFFKSQVRALHRAALNPEGLASIFEGRLEPYTYSFAVTSPEPCMRPAVSVRVQHKVHRIVGLNLASLQETKWGNYLTCYIDT